MLHRSGLLFGPTRRLLHVGFLSRLFGGTAYSAAALDLLTPAGRAVSGVVSPWGAGENHLQPFVYEDLTGNAGPVTRSQAMTVPAVAAARSVLLGSIANRPLRALRGPQLLDDPGWLQRTNSLAGPVSRMAHTLDDWIFYGDALWACTRGADGFVLDAQYAPRTHWRIDQDTAAIQVRTGAGPMDWRDADESEVLYLPGPFEGLLAVASDTIRGALDLERSWKVQARTPLPGLILQETEDNGMTASEMQEWVSAIAAARRKEDGAVMGIPHKVTATVAAPPAPDLLIEGRNAVKLDIANFLNLNPTMLGASLPKSSLNYETQDGARSEFTQRESYWTGPLEDRLSMDDVVPRGTRVRFDYNPTADPAGLSVGPTVED